MPRMEFTPMEKMLAMHQAIARDKHDPEDTLQLALTHKEVAILVSGVVLLDILMPEYVNFTDGLISKLGEVTKVQDFFSTRIPDEQEEA